MRKEWEEQLQNLFWSTAAYFRGNPAQIQHFTKVHSFAALLGKRERLPLKEQFILEAAAIVHDVGILPAMQKYQSGSGKYQEAEGPAVAERLLAALNFSEEVRERVGYLVGHHHTYTAIQGTDYQILVEADFLVNLFENGSHREQIAAVNDSIFRTASGKALLAEMFGE